MQMDGISTETVLTVNEEEITQICYMQQHQQNQQQLNCLRDGASKTVSAEAKRALSMPSLTCTNPTDNIGRSANISIAAPSATVIELFAGNEQNRQLRAAPEAAMDHEALPSPAETAQPPHHHQHHRHCSPTNTGSCDGRDICLLCDRCVAATSGRSSGGIDLDIGPDTEDTEGSEAEAPCAVRWRKLPCNCREQYLHLSCLETTFFEDSVYKGGRRQLAVNCRVCRVQLMIRRQRGRRTCDRQAWLAFARHLACAVLVAGLLLTFGLWSLLMENGRRPTVVNAGLVALGGVVLLAFACLEFWLLYARFELQFSRIGGGNSGGGSGSHNGNDAAAVELDEDLVDGSNSSNDAAAVELDKDLGDSSNNSNDAAADKDLGQVNRGFQAAV